MGWTQLGMQAAGTAIDAGMGLLLGNYNDRRQRMQQDKLQQMQEAGNKRMMDYQQQLQYDMWLKTNYGAQKAQMQKAGLNPALMYGMGGGGGSTTGSTSGGVTGGVAPSGGNEVLSTVGMGMQLRAQTELLRAQKENIEADTDMKRANTEFRTGVETDNARLDNAAKILQNVITKYTGMEAKDYYERVKRPNRAIEAKTYQDELEARQGVAGTIYELWQEGKLKDKSLLEIEQLAASKAKTDEEIKKIKEDIKLLGENIKGASLDNVLRELETKLQTETGIDKNAPTWMKILGRLFVTLFKK